MKTVNVGDKVKFNCNNTEYIGVVRYKGNKSADVEVHGEFLRWKVLIKDLEVI